ncbi:MAG: hypothetical protein Q9226_007906, partial [Calogaya cf. arnoldii]
MVQLRSGTTTKAPAPTGQTKKTTSKKPTGQKPTGVTKSPPKGKNNSTKRPSPREAAQARRKAKADEKKAKADERKAKAATKKAEAQRKKAAATTGKGKAPDRNGSTDSTLSSIASISDEAFEAA